MTEVQKLLDRAYGNLSKLSVSGEAVFLLAVVMQDLKAAYKAAAGPEEAEAEQEETDG